MRVDYGDLRLPDRFWEKVFPEPNTGCWLWGAAVSPKGYGQFQVATCTNRRAHRVCYEVLVGPVPDGLELDHLCRQRSCVNPAHLDPVTHAVNMARGVQAQKRVCGRCGSALVRPLWAAQRICPTCTRNSAREGVARKRSDPEYRAAQNARAREYRRHLRETDPQWRAKVNAQKRASYHRIAEERAARTVTAKKEPCSIDGCRNVARNNSALICNTHYSQRQRARLRESVARPEFLEQAVAS